MDRGFNLLANSSEGVAYRIATSFNESVILNTLITHDIFKDTRLQSIFKGHARIELFQFGAKVFQAARV
ncbi:MAG: hypothetical protein JW384_01715 [Nitrosomonadaceae bacterium]|nr:hypothetical protein [Nitrosomonadaceae bacterium]